MTRLTGKFIELYQVADLGGAGELETKIAETRGDVVMNFNPEKIDTSVHNETRKSRTYTHDAPEFSLEGLAVSDLGALTTVGLMDGSSKIKGFGTVGLDIRVKVYEKKGAASPALSMTWETVTFQLGDITFPEGGYAKWTGGGTIDGELTKEA